MTNLPHQPAPDRGHDSRVTAQVEQLYGTYQTLVRSVCRSMLRDRVEAEDAVQQTFLSAQRALLNGSSPREPAAWLATIARNESLARVRARMREPLSVEIGEHDAAPDAYAAALHKHEARELRNALSQLPRRQREAILLREVRGFTSDEVATALSVTAYAAESLMFRARRNLRMRLQGALAGVSPGPWLQPLRDLAARTGGVGLGAPAAAKVAAVGVGALLVTGGALVGPRAPFSGALRSPAGRSAHAAPTSLTSSSSVVQHAWSDWTTHSARTRHAANNDSTSRETSDNSRTSEADSTSQGTTETSSDPGNSKQDASGGSSTDSQSGSADAASSDSGSDSQSGGNPNDSQPDSTPSNSGDGG